LKLKHILEKLTSGVQNVRMHFEFVFVADDSEIYIGLSFVINITVSASNDLK